LVYLERRKRGERGERGDEKEKRRRKEGVCMRLYVDKRKEGR
jgi:hypothetical protein